MDRGGPTAALVLVALVGCRDFFVVPDAADAGVDVPDGGQAPVSDGGLDAEAAAGPLCSGNALVCDDFEEASLANRWSLDKSQVGELTEAQSASPTHSFHLSRPGQNAGVDYISKQFASSDDDTLQIELSLRTSTSEGVYAFGLFVGNRAIALNLDGAVIEGLNGGETASHKYTAVTTDGSWHRLRLRIDRKNSNVSFAVDGDLKLAKTAIAKLPDVASVTLAVGIYYAPANTAWEGWYDDIVVTRD